MRPIYHSTVSEALDNLTKMGFTYDYNIHEHEIENALIFMNKHVYRYEGTPEIQQLFMDNGNPQVCCWFFSYQIVKQRVFYKICIEGSGQCKI
jgi:hypothetical protein